MNTLQPCLFWLAVVVAGTLAGCSAASHKVAADSGGIRTSLDQAHDQGAVTLDGHEREAKTVNPDLDKVIKTKLYAALIREQLHEGVEYAVKNHVVTLTGEVDSPSKRARAEDTAIAVPNVRMVVNVLRVEGQMAASSK